MLRFEDEGLDAPRSDSAATGAAAAIPMRLRIETPRDGLRLFATDESAGYPAQLEEAAYRSASTREGALRLQFAELCGERAEVRAA